MSVSCSYLEPEREAGVQSADDGSRPVERDLNAISGQISPLAVPVHLNVVGIGPGHFIPLQVYAPDEDRSSDREVGSVRSNVLFWTGRHRRRCHAGQRLLVARIIGKTHPHLDSPALVGCHHGVGRVRRSRDVRVVSAVVPDPLVAVGDAGYAVGVPNARGVRRQRFPDLGRPSDGGWRR